MDKISILVSCFTLDLIMKKEYAKAREFGNLDIKKVKKTFSFFKRYCDKN